MHCPNCGKEYTVADTFCSECGKMLPGNGQNHVTMEAPTPETQKKERRIFFGIIAAIILLIAILGSRTNDAEYTNNFGDKLPIVVNEISYQSSFWTGYLDITFEIENLTQTDYRTANLAVLAWDSEGYPIRICGMFELEPDYVNYISLENLGPKKMSKQTYTIEDADIAYMSVFLSYYEDYNGKEWTSPIIEKVEKNQGQKLSEAKLCYFAFQ